jgi:hypothetical protein
VKRVDIGRKVEQRRNAASQSMKPELPKKMQNLRWFSS